LQNVLAVDRGGTHFRGALFDEHARRLQVFEGDTDRGAGAGVDAAGSRRQLRWASILAFLY
jgi:hypothetical protein